MRRLLVVLLALATLGLLGVVPAQAQEQARVTVPAPESGPDGRWIYTSKAQAALYHQDGFRTGKACVVRASTGRTYCVIGSAWMAHDGSSAHPEVFQNCTRAYGGVVVNTPCNWANGIAQLLQWITPTGGPAGVVSFNVPDPKCRTGSYTWKGPNRPDNTITPWNLGRLGSMQARFLENSGCAGWYLTNPYHIGSQAVQVFSEAEASTNYSGWRAI